MKLITFTAARYFLIGWTCFGLSLSKSAASSDSLDVFATTSAMRTQVRYTVTMLENFHLESRPISELSGKDILTEYLKELDPHHMMLTQEQVDAFIDHFASALSFYIKQGNLFAPFSIFADYKKDVFARLEWVEKRFEQPFDFNTDWTFEPDREKAPWPQNQAAADALWQRRLLYDLIAEILYLEKNPTRPPYAMPTRLSLLVKRVEENNLCLSWPVVFHRTLWQSTLLGWTEFTFPQLGHQYVFKLSAHRSPAEEEAVAQAIQATTLLSSERAAKKTIQDRYKRLKSSIEELEPSEVEEIFLTTVMEQYDPHSSFLSADTMEDFSILIQNSLIGIGAVLSEENDYCTVRELIAGGPAQLSGEMSVGDKIVGIAQGNGPMVDVVGMKLRKIVRMLRGPKGTQIRLLIEPMGGLGGLRKEVKLARDDVQIATQLAKARLIEVPCGAQTLPIGVIELSSFYGGADYNPSVSDCSKDVADLVEQLRAAGMRALVMDVRGNPGGIVEEVVDMAGLFIGKGPVLQVKDGSDHLKEYIDKIKKPLWEGPLVILTSRYSASCSEILAGALKDHNRALVVGDPSTTGKGTVQVLVEINPSMIHRIMQERLGAVKFTIQKWYLPKGGSIQLKGVPSDIVIPSVNPYLPIGEGELSHALPWDSISEIPWIYNTQTVFDPQRIAQLKESSAQRQRTLAEFAVLQAAIAFFKNKQEQKVFSLNLKQRLKERAADRAELNTLYRAFESLQTNLFAQKRFTLSHLKAPEADAMEEESLVDDDFGTRSKGALSGLQLIEAVSSSRAIFDIQLRETLRILADYFATQTEIASS